MNIEEIREWCLTMHPEVTEDTPFSKFDSEDVAFRINGKIFAFLLVDGSNMVVLKSAENRAIILRERYPNAIEPAFHWNKKYWNQIHYDNQLIKTEFMKELIREAFQEVVDKLPKKTRASLGL